MNYLQPRLVSKMQKINVCALVFISIAVFQTLGKNIAKREEPSQDCLIHNVLTNGTQAKWDKAYQKCTAETGSKGNIGFPEMKTSLEDFSFEDKECYNKCLYRQLEVLSSDESSIKKGVVDLIFKGNLTQELMSKTDQVWDSCVDDSQKVMEKKGDKPCMKFSLHQFCVMKKFQEEKVYNKC